LITLLIINQPPSLDKSIQLPQAQIPIMDPEDFKRKEESFLYYRVNDME